MNTRLDTALVPAVRSTAVLAMALALAACPRPSAAPDEPEAVPLPRAVASPQGLAPSPLAWLADELAIAIADALLDRRSNTTPFAFEGPPRWEGDAPSLEDLEVLVVSISVMIEFAASLDPSQPDSRQMQIHFWLARTGVRATGHLVVVCDACHLREGQVRSEAARDAVLELASAIGAGDDRFLAGPRDCEALGWAPGSQLTEALCPSDPSTLRQRATALERLADAVRRGEPFRVRLDQAGLVLRGRGGVVVAKTRFSQVDEAAVLAPLEARRVDELRR